MQNVEEFKRARRPERPAQVTAKKETALSPESVPKHEDHRQIIARKRKKIKWKNSRRLRILYMRRALAVAALLFLVFIVLFIATRTGDTEAETQAAGQTEETTTTPTEAPETGYFAIYMTADGEPQLIDMESLANAWAAEAGFEVRYQLTDAERYEVAQIVTAEAAGEPLAGKIAICQCLLQASEDDGIRPPEAAVRYSYAKSRPEPTDEALLAVTYVFDFGLIATTEPIKYFYNPDRVSSDFHESQRYVLTINNHRFYAEIKK